MGEGCVGLRPMRKRRIMQRGTPENLWPKFILKGAPLRATSSAAIHCTCYTNAKRLKINRPEVCDQVGFSSTLETFTRDSRYFDGVAPALPYRFAVLWKSVAAERMRVVNSTYLLGGSHL